MNVQAFLSIRWPSNSVWFRDRSLQGGKVDICHRHPFLGEGGGDDCRHLVSEISPNRPSIQLASLDRRGYPAFQIRFPYTRFAYGNPAGGGPHWVSLQTGNKLNGNGTLLSGKFKKFMPYGVHTFLMFISSKEYAASHPEYFSMANWTNRFEKRDRRIDCSHVIRNYRMIVKQKSSFYGARNRSIPTSMFIPS